MAKYKTINITEEHYNAMKAYLEEKGLKSFDFLLWKAFEQYTRKR